METIMSTLVAEGNEEGKGFNSEAAYQPIGDKAVHENLRRIHMIQTLKWLHFLASVVFFIQIFVYAAVRIDANTYPTVGKPVDCEDRFCDSDITKLERTNVQFLFPIIMVVAFCVHLASLMQYHYNEPDVRKWIFLHRTFPLRWVEYSVTYPLAIVIVSILVGVTDVHLWFCHFMLTAVAMVAGQVMELMPRLERPDLWPLSFRVLRRILFGCMAAALLAPWVTVSCYYFRAIDKHLPVYVHVAFWGTLLGFLALGENAFQRCVMDKFEAVFGRAEIIYVNVSVATKTFLAATVYLGLRV